jgi:glucose/arabinose dehydrogenase
MTRPTRPARTVRPRLFTRLAGAMTGAALALTAITCTTPAAQAPAAPPPDPIPHGIDASPVKVKAHLVAEGLTNPLWATNAGDGSGRLFVIEQVGRVRIIKDGKLLAKPALDVSGLMVELKPNFDERGLLGLAFHPGFADRNSPGFGKVYTYTSHPIDAAATCDFPLAGVTCDHQSVITEWQFSKSDPDVIDPSTRREVLRFDEPQFNHDGGCIVFGHDGMLYIPTGDGGNAMDQGPGHTEPQGNAQDLSKALGKIMRIDPLGRSGKLKVKGRYSVPDDNPFVGRPDALDVVWAYGLRNPFRISVDRKTGILVAGDVGQNNIEEIDVIVKGGNYGWRIKEGTFWFSVEEGKVGEVSKTPYPSSNTKVKLIDPVAAYDHDEGISIIGGYVYRGKALPQLDGLYITGDWKRKEKPDSGRIFTCNLKTGDLRELLPDGKAIGPYICGMGQDEAGEVYVLTTNIPGPTGDSGKVYRIVAGE